MESVIIGLAIKWVVGELVQASGQYDWLAFKGKVKIAIESSVHSAWMDAALEKMANECIDAIAKMGSDSADIAAALQSLAGKNMPAAEAALKALLMPVVSQDLGSIIQAL